MKLIFVYPLISFKFINLNTIENGVNLFDPI